MATRYVVGFQDRPWWFCSEQCKIDFILDIGKDTWFEAMKTPDQVKTWTQWVADHGKCMVGCGADIPSPIPSDAIFILADPITPSNYFGFGCVVVEIAGRCAIVACPPKSVEWMQNRLASGMRELGYERYASLDEARAAIVQW